MKKVNAAVGLLCAALLLLHMLVQAYIYGTMHYLKTLSALTANVFGILTAAHALGSVLLLLFKNDGGLRVRYARFNRRTLWQRGSALGILLLLPLHTNTFALLRAAAGKLAPVLALLAAEVLFFALAACHAALSVRNGLISLGWLETEEQAKRADRAAGAVIGLVALAAAAIVVRGQLLMTGMLGGGAG